MRLTPRAANTQKTESPSHRNVPSRIAAKRVRDLEKELGAAYAELSKFEETKSALLAHVSESCRAAKITHTTVDINALLKKIAQHAQGLLTTSHVSLRLCLDNRACTMQGDESLLSVACTQLLKNAILFNNPDGDIAVSTRRSEGGIQISFLDTGIGIPRELHEKIFSSFFQVADHMTRTVGGLGLGLALARRIFEAHGGGVWVDDSGKNGSEFIIDLPADGR